MEDFVIGERDETSSLVRYRIPRVLSPAKLRCAEQDFFFFFFFFFISPKVMDGV